MKGTDNSAADALSRIGVNQCSSEHPVVPYAKLAAAQHVDPELSRLRETSTTLAFEDIQVPDSDFSVTCDMSTGQPRPFIPTHLRRAVFDSLHNLSHPGIRATQRLLVSRFIWPRINADARDWARTCVQCQRSKIHRHTVTPLGTFSPPDARFAQIHVDVVGPLPVQ